MADDRDKQSMGESRSLVGANSPFNITYRPPANPGTGGWFGPLDPMKPMAPPSVKGRILDYPSGYNLQQRPRAYETITFGMLRSFADGCDLVRLLIETRKDQMARLTWNLTPRDKSLTKKGATIPQDVQDRVNAIEAFFLRPDKENFWAEWLSMLLEDLFVLDAPALYRRKTYGGDLYALQPLDGGTIKRVIDSFGNTPIAPDPAYQQVLKGYPAVDYTTDELIYKPRVRRTHKVYGYSPVEQVVMTINIAMRRQAWQLQSFTEGNIPEALIGTPATWTPDQVASFQDWFDGMLEGNTAQKRKARFVPGDVAKGYIPTKPAELFGAAEEWLARVICFAFSVSPQPFVAQVNRATAETAHEAAISEGLAPIQNWVKGLIDTILIEDFDSPDLEFKWLEEDELDPNVKSQIVDRDQSSGRLTYNEARREQGHDPFDHPDADRPMYKATDGSWHPIFLTPEEQAQKDALTAALPGAPGGDTPPGDDKGDGDGDGDGGDGSGNDGPPGDGTPAPPGGSKPSDTPPAGKEVAEKSDRPLAKPHGLECGCGLAKVGRASNSNPLDPLRPFAAKIEKALATDLAKGLKKAGRKIAKQVVANLPEPKVTKADDKDFDLDGLLHDLDFSTFELMQEDLEDAFGRITSDGGRIALSQIGQLAEAEGLADKVNSRALTWAKDRAAELVSFDDDVDPILVSATRDMIRGTIAAGIADNIGLDAIADALEASYAFSEDRANLIAATEITSANSEGALAGYEEAKAEGVSVKKSWLILEDACDICQENADAGTIELDEEFPSGDMAPGAHPNCRCVLVPEVEDADGNVTEGDDEDLGDDNVEQAVMPDGLIKGRLGEGGDLDKADQPRNRRGKFTADPGESFMPGMVAGIPGVKAKIGHVITELAPDVEDVEPSDDTSLSD